VGWRAGEGGRRRALRCRSARHVRCTPAAARAAGSPFLLRCRNAAAVAAAATRPAARYIYASILHKTNPSDPGHFVAFASSQQAALRDGLLAAGRPTSDTTASAEVGRLLAERARGGAGLEAVYFDREKGRRYTGKLKALIEALRAHGLQVR
jgi:ribosomal protein L18